MAADQGQMDPGLLCPWFAHRFHRLLGKIPIHAFVPVRSLLWRRAGRDSTMSCGSQPSQWHCRYLRDTYVLRLAGLAI